MEFPLVVDKVKPGVKSGSDAAVVAAITSKSIRKPILLYKYKPVVDTRLDYVESHHIMEVLIQAYYTASINKKFLRSYTVWLTCTNGSFRIIVMRGFGSPLALSLLSVALQIELQPVLEGGGLDLRLVQRLFSSTLLFGVPVSWTYGCWCAFVMVTQSANPRRTAHALYH